MSSKGSSDRINPDPVANILKDEQRRTRRDSDSSPSRRRETRSNTSTLTPSASRDIPQKQEEEPNGTNTSPKQLEPVGSITIPSNRSFRDVNDDSPRFNQDIPLSSSPSSAVRKYSREEK